jgi:hypothetical protein
VRFEFVVYHICHFDNIGSHGGAKCKGAGSCEEPKSQIKYNTFPFKAVPSCKMLLPKPPGISTKERRLHTENAALHLLRAVCRLQASQQEADAYGHKKRQEKPSLLAWAGQVQRNLR